ncbi:MAG: CBS domain-containing protein [Nitrospira sp.]|nr:CBS domain-containing protein [Candidatus Manganitrophaceae bacterium]HIL35148.1 CBS domain-containing protein [Candidatus Manganitrophaceae bacterium]
MRRIDFRVGGKSMTEVTASHVMERDVFSCGGETSCDDMAETLVKEGFGSLPIVEDDSTLIGLVSEYDILDALMKGKYLLKTPASEVMTQPVVSINESTPIKEVIALLQSRHLIRVPVVDHEGRLIGLVARRDIIGCYLETSLGPQPVF